MELKQRFRITAEGKKVHIGTPCVDDIIEGYFSCACNGQFSDGSIFELVDSDAYCNVLDLIEDKLKELEYAARDIDVVVSGLIEAYESAQRHSKSSRAPSLFVRITSGYALLVLNDHGKGFNLDDVPPCTAEAGIEKISGRGVDINTERMNLLIYNRKGNCVLMVKLRDDKEPLYHYFEPKHALAH